MRPALIDLLEAEGALAVRHGVPEEGVGELVDEIEVGRLAVHRKCSVARSATGRDAQGLDGGGGQILPDRVDAHNIGTQVWNEDELACWVGDSLVRMRSFLAIRVGTWLFQLEDLLIQEGEGGRVGSIPGTEGRAGAEGQSVCYQDGCVCWHWTD